MFPIYFVVGLLNIFSQHHNYGIDIKDPDFDIRVRRSIGEDAKQQVLNLHNNEDTNLNREKRSAYYEKTRISNKDIPQYSNGSQSARNSGNRYDIFNPNWNFLFNTTRKTRNGDNSRVNNKRPIINSYPYGYPPGYGPKKNSATGNDRITTTTGYRNQDSNTPYFYNYQNPDGRNFAGYVGYASNVSEQRVTPGPRYSHRAKNNNNNAWNYVLAPYPPTNTQKPLKYMSTNNLPASYSTTNTQKPLTYMSTNNLPASYSTTHNPRVHNLPYATNPVNRNYNNNFNNIPKPYVKDNLSPYVPIFNNRTSNIANGYAVFNNGTSNFANGSAVFNNGLANWNNATTNFANGSTDINSGSVDFNNGTHNIDNGSPSFNNGSYAPANNTITTVTTTEKIVSGCVICNIPCPQFMRRFGRFCMPEDVDNDY